MDLINRATSNRGGARVEEDVGSKEPHGFPGNLWETHLLWEKAVQMDRVTEVHGIQPRQGFLGKTGNQGGLEEALG